MPEGKCRKSVRNWLRGAMKHDFSVRETFEITLLGHGTKRKINSSFQKFRGLFLYSF